MSSKVTAMGKNLESENGFWVVKFVQGEENCGYVSLFLMTAMEVQMYPNPNWKSAVKFPTKKTAQSFIDLHSPEQLKASSVVLSPEFIQMSVKPAVTGEAFKAALEKADKDTAKK